MATYLLFEFWQQGIVNKIITINLTFSVYYSRPLIANYKSYVYFMLYVSYAAMEHLKSVSDHIS